MKEYLTAVFQLFLFLIYFCFLLIKEWGTPVLKSLIKILRKHIRPLTLSMAILCCLVTFVGALGRDYVNIDFLFMSDFYLQEGYVYWREGFVELTQGQVWRPFSPLFIHFGGFHLFFSVTWLLFLGSQIERVQGWKFFLFLILLMAGASHFTQLYVDGPFFGGMSAVVYGLFAYVAIRHWCFAKAGFIMDKGLFVFLFGFFLFSVMGMMGNFSPLGHGAGIGVGILMAFMAKVPTSLCPPNQK
jgi:membrane associated rhomboid family serine protease